MRRTLQWICVLLTLLCLAEGAWILRRELPDAGKSEGDAPELYAAAVRDAVFADADEIEPLVALTRADERMTWEPGGGRVLLLTWNGEPESYPEGERIAALPSAVWAFADREMAEQMKEADEETDWTLRMAQLLGLPADCGCTHVSGLWVRPEDVVRPAFVTDPAAQMRIDPDVTDAPEGFREWFDAFILTAYFEDAYPWTRLGYTYDWADNGREYGVTEFLILPGASAEVAFTLETEDYRARLKSAAGIGETS